MLFTIRTTQKDYASFNGHKCKIVSTNRDDGLYEVYIPVYGCLILLSASELEEDE